MRSSALSLTEGSYGIVSVKDLRDNTSGSWQSVRSCGQEVLNCAVNRRPPIVITSQGRITDKKKRKIYVS